MQGRGEARVEDSPFWCDSADLPLWYRRSAHRQGKQAREGEINDASTASGKGARRGYILIAGREIPDDRELYRSIIAHDRDPIARLKARVGLLVDGLRIRLYRLLLTSPQLSWIAHLFLGYVGVVTALRTAVMNIRVFLVRPVQLILLVDVLAALLLAFFVADFFTGNVVEQLAGLINDWLIKPQLDFVLGEGNLIEQIPAFLTILVNALFDVLAYIPLQLGLMDPATVITAKSVSAHIAKVGFLIPKISYIIRLELVIIAFLLRFPLFARKTAWEDSLPKLMK